MIWDGTNVINNRNQVHNKCNILESSQNRLLPHPTTILVCGKSVFHKTGPCCQQVWGPLFQSLRCTTLDHSHSFYCFPHTKAKETSINMSSGRIPWNLHTIRGEKRKEDSKLFWSPLPSFSLNIQCFGPWPACTPQKSLRSFPSQTYVVGTKDYMG